MGSWEGCVGIQRGLVNACWAGLGWGRESGLADTEILVEFVYSGEFVCGA